MIRSPDLKRSHRLRLALFGRQDFPTINPGLYANHSVCRPRLTETVLDICPQRVQRQTSLQVPLRTRDFVSVQTPADANLDPLASEAQRRIDGFTHCTAETNSLLQLQRDGFRNQLCIKLRLVHFLNIDVDLAIGALLQLAFELVDFGALAANNNSRARGLNNDAQLVARALDFYRAHARRLQLVFELVFQPDVFEQKFVVIATTNQRDFHGLVYPSRNPYGCTFCPINLLNYFFATAFLPAGFFFATARFFFAGAAWAVRSSPTTVARLAPFFPRSANAISMCAMRLTYRKARPIGAGRMRFIRGPSFATACFT